MARLNLISFPTLALIILLSSMHACRKVTGRNLKAATLGGPPRIGFSKPETTTVPKINAAGSNNIPPPDIPNFGFPELDPPGPVVPFFPPGIDPPPAIGSKREAAMIPKFKEIGSYDIPPPDIPNFGFPELDPPGPVVPFFPPGIHPPPVIVSEPELRA